MRYCAEYCVDVPDDFPIDELTAFMASARRTLLHPAMGREWNEFAAASNLIGWRYRASSEDWLNYRHSWQTEGVAVNHEGLYRRERALFGMFSAGVACIDSAAYALAALSSHPGVLAIAFGPTEQRACSPKQLLEWLAPMPKAAALSQALSKLCASAEWKLWVALRNRMSHRSNLPCIVFGAVGSEPPLAKALHFAATSSTPIVEGDLESFDALHAWLAWSLTELLVEGTNLCAT
ncbi:hypothetical protein [Aromatoleum diolicum]|uniref:Uncharacterized protein n=1 Tax=Aromatoleum diolicum TaxID=75796 RepID=A0ABX1Q716_9RHOO|nr:hypothetical protein [Aromatoleum diolicum]NMG74103.1 hypothetical protein [Aromatoleum diolicum]